MMNKKDISENCEGVIKQLKYDLDKLMKKYNISSDDNIEWLVGQYYFLKGQIASLTELNEFLNDEAYK